MLFERVYNRSWYIEGVEDEAFEKLLQSIVIASIALVWEMGLMLYFYL